jgi:hypothetical protein
MPHDSADGSEVKPLGYWGLRRVGTQGPRGGVKVPTLLVVGSNPHLERAILIVEGATRISSGESNKGRPRKVAFGSYVEG